MRWLRAARRAARGTLDLHHRSCSLRPRPPRRVDGERKRRLVTPRHAGAHLGLAGFAKRAGVAPVTLRSYISRHKQDAAFMAANPVPTHCGSEPISGRRWWCEKHIDQWIDNRPRKKDPRTGPEVR